MTSARRLAALLTLVLAAAGALPAIAAGAVLPPIHHVYVIVLENESASTSFAVDSPAPYLAHGLTAAGAFLPAYHGTGHESNDNYIAMISGQAPNAENQADCQDFSDFPAAVSGQYGQQEGEGCVYPATVPTIASQFDAGGLTWRDYNQSMGADPSRESGVCGHPPVNGQDHTQSATATDEYAARHNPFVYFHSIIDDTALCDSHVVSLDPLAQDLAVADGPNLTFITPDLCHDAHDATCANGSPGGLPGADAFLRTWIPQIMASPSYRLDGGLIAIVFDEAATSDTTACCGEIPGPGSPEPGVNGPGGGDTGAVLLSPYIHPGTVTKVPYNHYALLRSVEDLFRLPHIGYAQLPGEVSFGSDVFACEPRATPIVQHGVLPAGSEYEHVAVARHGRSATLRLLSVGNSSLHVQISLRRGRRRRVIRTLAPCTTYTIPLGKGRGRVTLAAHAGGGAQTLRRSF